LDDAKLMSGSGLGPLDYAAVVLYLLVTFGIAIWFGSRQKNTEDFFVGGRRMPWLAVGLSILATLFSTITYLGAPGEVIKHGIGFFLGYLAIPLNFLVVMFLWVPFFMRLKLTSAYEYLEKRFSYPVRAAGGILFICLRLGWMSMVIFVASMALDRIKGPDIAWLRGPDLYWWIAAIGLVAAVYTSIGGIQAVIWVDVLQCILLLSGVLLAIGYVLIVDGTGPATWWRVATEVSPQHTAPPVFSFDLTLRVTIVTAVINNFFWTICTHGSDQVVLQRYFATSSLQAARRSYLTNLVVDLTMVGLLAVAGLALLAFYVRHTGLLPGGQSPLQMADKLFPHFLGNQLPAGFAGLIMSAFLCDAIQTLESGVNGITAVVVKDFLGRTQQTADDPRPDVKADAEQGAGMLSVSRQIAFFVCVLVAANACLVAYVAQRLELSIVDMMPRFFNMFVGPLAAIFFAGMFLPRCTTRSILPAALCGLAVAIVWSWWDGIATIWPTWGSIFGWDAEGKPLKPAFTLAIAVPCVTAFVVAGVLSLILDRPGKHSGSGYTWWAIVRTPPGAKESP